MLVILDFQDSYGSKTFRAELFRERKKEMSEQDKIDCEDALDLLSLVIRTLGKVRMLLVTNYGSTPKIWTDCCKAQQELVQIQEDLMTSANSYSDVRIVRRNL